MARQFSRASSYPWPLPQGVTATPRAWGSLLRRQGSPPPASRAGSPPYAATLHERPRRRKSLCARGKGVPTVFLKHGCAPLHEYLRSWESLPCMLPSMRVPTLRSHLRRCPETRHPCPGNRNLRGPLPSSRQCCPDAGLDSVITFAE